MASAMGTSDSPWRYVPLAMAALGVVAAQWKDLYRPGTISAFLAQALAKRATRRRRRRPVRVYMDGCFDMMHYGHFNALRQAKACGDVLVVGVVPDAEIRRCKGPPVLTEEERLAMVRGVKWVDEVIPGVPYDVGEDFLEELFVKHRIDLVVHGDDPCLMPDGRDAYEAAKKAGKFRTIKRTEGVSTTDIVGRMLMCHRAPSTTQNGDTHQQLREAFSLGRSFHSEPKVDAEPRQVHPDGESSDGGSSDTGSEGDGPHLQEHRIESMGSQRTSDQHEDPEKKDLAQGSPSQHHDEEQGQETHGPLNTSVSNFLPTSRRILQFSNARTAKPEDKVVYMDGAFDMFHPGHVDILREAKKLGDFLIVGIHPDELVSAHRGAHLPIMNVHERTLSVLACRHVDEVIISAPAEVTLDLVQTFNIQVVVHGTSAESNEHPHLDKDKRYKVPMEMGIFLELRSPRDMTTSGLIDRILRNREQYLERNRKKSSAENEYYTTGKHAFVEEK
eukprot:scaffold626_cov337-Pavlova_lutheri.AAC.23